MSKVTLQRNTHFLGSKIRALRKRNGLTLEDLSTRCIQLDAQAAPSVSYLSMIETGKRVPSPQLLQLMSDVFQRDISWFLDENLETDVPSPPERSGGLKGIPLEPDFLFSKPLLQTALPELLSQTGTTGRQFAQLLIRSHQEMQQNRFPDLERAAEETGGKRFPVDEKDLLGLFKHHGLKISWFDQPLTSEKDASGNISKTLMCSFFEGAGPGSGTVYVNKRLRASPQRLKYELAGYLGHKVLHNGDGLKSIQAAGGLFGSPAGTSRSESDDMNARDILFAWRDFECSYFAAALLSPRLPFRRFLVRETYDPLAGDKVGLTAAVVMRRMTSVSPYPHWHYFDAYPPGRLRAVYRGNGIPLPWGNMTMVSDPCPQWAVFRLLDNSGARKPVTQISLLKDKDIYRLYCCLSLRTTDVADNKHVISVGLDLIPALQSRGINADALLDEAVEHCQSNGGEAMLPDSLYKELKSVARVLNIAWIEQGLNQPARVICPRRGACPSVERCGHHPVKPKGAPLEQIRQDLLAGSDLDN